MRISYGYNGIIMRGTDVGPFAEYLVRKQLNMPVDLLAAEWFVSAIPETCVSACLQPAPSAPRSPIPLAARRTTTTAGGGSSCTAPTCWTTWAWSGPLPCVKR